MIPATLAPYVRDLRVILAAALLFALFVIHTLRGNIDDLNQQIGEAKAQINLSINANESLAQSFYTAQEASDTCNAQWTQVSRKNEDVEKTLQQTREVLYREQLEKRRYIESIYATPSCQELGNISITSACPALATSLRNFASRIDKHVD